MVISEENSTAYTHKLQIQQVPASNVYPSMEEAKSICRKTQQNIRVSYLLKVCRRSWVDGLMFFNKQ